MAYQQPSRTLDLKLIFRYSGLKATQYFTKFDDKSDKVFREDLLALKLPHPKRENTNLLSHGLVECFWLGVQREHILHRQILTRIQPGSELGEAYLDKLHELSISSIILQQDPPDPRSHPYVPRPPAVKLPSSETSAVKANAYIAPPRTTALKRPAPEDVYRTERNPYPLVLDSSYDHVPPPAKVAKTHSGGFQLPQKPSFNTLPAVPPKRASAGYDREARAATEKAYGEARRKPKEEDIAVDAFLSDIVSSSRGSLVKESTMQPRAGAGAVQGSTTTTTTDEGIPGLKLSPAVPKGYPSRFGASSHAPLPTPPSSAPLLPVLDVAALNDLSAILKKTEAAAELEQQRKRLSDTEAQLAHALAQLADERRLHANTRLLLDEQHRLRDGDLRALDEHRRLLAEERRARADERQMVDDAGRLLKREMLLREEAEKALADVRRECRAPFVVPSLLDAFVEVSRLTTRGMNLNLNPGARGAAAAARPPPAISRTGSGQTRWDVQSPSGKGKAREVRVKMEPADDMVMP